MKISTTKTHNKSDILFVFLKEDAYKASQFEVALPATHQKAIKKLQIDKDFKGKTADIYPLLHLEPKTYVVGIGEGENIDIKKAAAKALKVSNEKKYTNIAFAVPKKTMLESVILGAELGRYRFKIGDTRKQKEVKKLSIVQKEKIAPKGITNMYAIPECVNYVRDLVNTPPDRVTTTALANEAKEIAKRGGVNLKVKVLGEKEARKQGMGALLAVGQGGRDEVKLIVFEYKAGKKKDPTQAFIGKGIVFDSGGYNLKPTNHIEDMKMDMGGAATVLGLFHWIAKTKPKKNVIGVIAAAENMVSAEAYRPGDIITAMNGKTIEVLNTDAEGRLVLADALYYAATKLKPDSMVDLATLTGAVIGALGYDITGVMGNNKGVIEGIKKASEKVDEDVWELPLNKAFQKGTENDISDLKNINRKIGAGSSMAGAFLQNFVEDIPWAHLDIAGTAFHDTPNDLGPRGATGAMLQTLIELVREDH